MKSSAPSAGRAVSERIAAGAKTFLGASCFFLLGLAVAQLDSVKTIVKNSSSDEEKAEFLPYARESFEKRLTVASEAANPLEGGAVLLSPEYGTSPALILVDGSGNILHRWYVENKLFNPDLLQVWNGLGTNQGFSIDDAKLLPNGDIVFVQVAMGANNYRGQRLARMDKDSHILWQVPGNFHHYIDIGGAPAKIYTLSSRIADHIPEAGPQLLHMDYLDDWVESYTLDGKKSGAWSVTEAFARSPYRNWLTSYEIDIPEVQQISLPNGHVLFDLLHTNSVQYLDSAKAKALPFAQEGDLLLSLRALSAIAVMRPSTNQIVWATKGAWRHQHNVRVEPDGKLYIYDNDGRQRVQSFNGGTPWHERQTRVISFNPLDNQVDEIFAAQKIYSFFMGDYEHMDNGSWVISSPYRGRVVVVSPDKKILWQLRTVPDFDINYIPRSKQISRMHYYPASMLGFLQTSQGDSP